MKSFTRAMASSAGRQLVNAVAANWCVAFSAICCAPDEKSDGAVGNAHRGGICLR